MRPLRVKKIKIIVPGIEPEFLSLSQTGLEYHNISTVCYDFKLLARLIDIAYVIV